MAGSQLHIRIDPETKATLKAAATRHRRTLSAWALSTLLAAAKERPIHTPAELEALRALADQVRRVGNNINQAVKLTRARAALAPDADDWGNLEGELRAIQVKIKCKLGEIP